MKNSFVSFRCPLTLLDALDTKAEAQRTSRSALIVKLLEANLGLLPSNTDVIPTDSVALEVYLSNRDALLLEKIGNLEKRVADLESQVLPKKTNVIQTPRPTPTVSLPKNWDTLKKKGLTERQLVARLQKKASWIKASTLRLWATEEKLAEITRTHDPDQLGWKLVKGLYRPIPPMP